MNDESNIPPTAWGRLRDGLQGLLNWPATVMDDPDLDNRAPSLVSWVAHDIDAAVRELLDGVNDSSESGVGSDSVHRIRRAGDVIWARSWKLFDSTSVRARVTVEVPEEMDNLVSVSVDGHCVAEGRTPSARSHVVGRRSRACPFRS